MKIALVHDSFLYFGGAERVLLSLARLYPRADIFFGLSNSSFEQFEEFKNRKITTSYYSSIPFIGSLANLFKPFLFWYWESLNLNEYDLVITSSHSFSSKAIITGTQTLHVSYIHTSPRYLYTEYNETKIIRNQKVRHLLSPILSFLRQKDYLAGQRPDLLIANSKTTQKRIKKYYRRESIVIYPPVKMPNLKSKYKTNKSGYFLCFSRLVKQKGVELIVKTCTQYNLPLVVIGTGPEKRHLERISGSSITFKGFVSESEKATLFKGAKALLNCAKEEDFGLAVVEALSYGLPVIAYKSGGVTETVIDGKVGILFNEYSSEGLYAAIQKFNHLKITSDSCMQQAELFSESVFIKSIKKIVKQEMKKISD